MLETAYFKGLEIIKKGLKCLYKVNYEHRLINIVKYEYLFVM